MKKLLFVLFILPAVCIAQDYYFGLIGNSFLVPKVFGSDEFLRIKQNIALVYNHNYCYLYFGGKGSQFFPVREFKKSMSGPYTHTSFISKETDVTPDGYYLVMIDENKSGVTFQVSLPNGYTYISDRSKKFSPNGPVKSNIQVLNYDEIIKMQNKQDSLTQSHKFK